MFCSIQIKKEEVKSMKNITVRRAVKVDATAWWIVF